MARTRAHRGKRSWKTTAQREGKIISVASYMAVALQTSKRKFEKLLNSLSSSGGNGGSSIAHKGGPSTKHNVSVTTLAEPPRKRVRASEDDAEGTIDGPSTPPRPQSLRERAAVLRAAKKKETPPPPATAPKPLPNYAPWSQEQFLARLRSFADIKLWTPKPDAISEVEWAKRGWMCEGINTVTCKGGCERRLVVALRPKRKDGEGKEIECSEDYSVEVGKCLPWQRCEAVARRVWKAGADGR